MDTVFETYRHDNLQFRNRIIKSGIYEGRCDHNGIPLQSYIDFYDELAKKGAGGLITGFAYVSKEGKAMQPRQAGIDSPDKIPYFRLMTDAVHKHACPVYLQISHAGRQTLPQATGLKVRAASEKKSVYFRIKPVPLSTAEVYERIEQYAQAAYFAKEAGFDGIQLHAAHGYLIHQFILPAINNRNDEFGIDKDTRIGTLFFEKIIRSVREKCGEDFPVLVKVSGAVDLSPAFKPDQFVELIRFLDRMKVSGIEISYGTMDHALNIFRGDFPEELILSKNPILKSRDPARRLINRIILKRLFKPRFKPFTMAYNLEYAKLAKKHTGITVISVGGFRSKEQIRDSILSGSTDLAALARPFLCEPDIAEKMKSNESYVSKCINCNQCSVMCDSDHETHCYRH